MLAKGVFASLFSHDVEKGLPKEEKPLLEPSNNGRNSGRIVRPIGLPGPDTASNPHRYPFKLGFVPEQPTPSSEPSTTANTPLTGTELPRRWRRSDRRLRRLNTELLEAIGNCDNEEVEQLLDKGANPNATCRLDLVSACHIAAMTGGDALSLLVKFGAEKLRLDRLGRTPLHLAAWSGNARQMAILLDFPEDMHDRVDGESMSSDAEEDVKKLCSKTREMANVRCNLGEVQTELVNEWKDNIDHNCMEIKDTLPDIQPGWTPLHVATSKARQHCTRLLLAAGADPNICDVTGRTPLDVVGFAYYYKKEINTDHFTEIIKMLLKAGGKFNTMRMTGLNNLDTPLHTAVNLNSIDAIKELLAAGAWIGCLNTTGETPLHVCVRNKFEIPLQLLANHDHKEAHPLSATVDVKDIEGHTVLQAAVERKWVEGVCVALEAGADVTLKANDGETPIHSAAELGNLDVLNEILSIAKQKDSIDYQNAKGETALFKAITNGHLDCVKAILNEGASIKITIHGEINVFHVAAERGHKDILKELLEFDEDITEKMIDALTASDKKGFGPIHFAVAGNHVDCVKLLLSKKADIRLRTTHSPHKSSTPLHIAAVMNHREIAELLLSKDKTIIHEVNGMGWFPLHTAGHHGSRDVIMLLLREGADLSGYTDDQKKKSRTTAFDLIVNNLSKPTEFLEEVFDSYIKSNGLNLQDTNCKITVDYRILMPTVCEMEQMKVIEALLKTGNRFGQKRLLVHPLMESFLYLKWRALLPFFYTILFFYAIFVLSLTIFVISLFFYKDTHDTPPAWLDPKIWCYVVYASICLILIQELLYMNVKSSRYFLQFETWVKFGSICCATILPPAVLISSWSAGEWPRHVATMALLLSWVEMMFLLSRFPNWGYYVLMFGKVASNVIKILLTFAFLVIGFSLSFMVQFRSQTPFEGPWAAFVKTIVMMTSEFDYVALFDEEHAKDLSTSIIIVRIIFLVFLILAAIVLMNLMVGVAVNDINDLEVLGNIRRLVKQVEFLSTLDTLVYNRVFSKVLPTKINRSIKNKRNVESVITLSPGKSRRRYYKLPSRLKDAIFAKAQKQKEEMDDKLDFEAFKTKLDQIHQAVTKNTDDVASIKSSESPAKETQEDFIKKINNLDNGLNEMKNQITGHVEDCKAPIETLNVKMDQMSLEIEAIKEFLSRLESKLGMIKV